MLRKYDRDASKYFYDMVTSDESWIYVFELESKQQLTVWLFQDETNPTKVSQARSTLKEIIACLLRKTAHVAIVPLELRRTVNSECYATICLPVVFQEIRKTKRRRRITHHHVNVSSRTSGETIAFLRT